MRPEPESPSPTSEFKREMAQLLNKYSKENNSNTPDYILAAFLVNVLIDFDLALQTREAWGQVESIKAQS